MKSAVERAINDARRTYSFTRRYMYLASPKATTRDHYRQLFIHLAQS